VGKFDVVVCGSLILHLRDPLRALAAIRSVCDGVLLSAEEIRIDLPMAGSRRPLLELDGVSELVQWFVPNAAGHVRMLESSGFEIERAVRRYAIPFGVAHPAYSRGSAIGDRVVRRLQGLGRGIPHHAALARSI
jgi:tRNA (mo5U34)-methyltransferase